MKTLSSYLASLRLLLVVPLLWISLPASSQNVTGNVTGEQIDIVPMQDVDVVPQFDDGRPDAFSHWINSQLRYPVDAMIRNVQGRVTVKFTITSKGILRDAIVLRGVDPLLDAEALRVVSMSPEWTPAMMKGKPVAVSMAVPVFFSLQNLSTMSSGPVSYDLADNKPMFRRKDASAFSSWVARKFRYPKEAKIKRLEGIVTVQFVISKDGTLGGFKVTSETDPLLNNEVLRVMKKSPVWKPGEKNGKSVDVQYVVSVPCRIKK